MAFDRQARETAAGSDAATKHAQRLVDHLIRRGDREKASLAREMHDELGSNLTAVNLDVAAVEDKLKAADPVLAARLRRALDSLRRVVGLSRRIIEDLRPSALEHMDLADALRGVCEDFTERSGLECDVDEIVDVGEVDHDTATALFRIAHEALENAARHARPSRVAVSLANEAGGIRLRIADNGSGLPDDAFDRPATHGLLEMRARMAIVGGTFDIRPGSDGAGTLVEARVPVEAPAR